MDVFPPDKATRGRDTRVDNHPLWQELVRGKRTKGLKPTKLFGESPEKTIASVRSFMETPRGEVEDT